MNSDRVKVLVNIYKEKYQDLTQGRIDVRDKWVAVYTCLKNWDIMAEDFGAMFEASMQDAEFLLDHGEVRPTDGIVMLCRGGRTEEVREAFADLLQHDGGDIAQRQQRVRAFTETINSMLDQQVQGCWKLHQKIRTVIKYLGLIRPEDNYMLRASAAAAFEGYIDYEDDIGYDRLLKLQNYYNMCDDTLDLLLRHEDFLKLIDKGLREKGEQLGMEGLADIDKARHILVFDLIDSAYRFNFYAEKSANRKSKISTVAQRKIDRTRRRAELIDEREECVDSFDEIKAMEKDAKIPSLEGRTALHPSFGEGTIIGQDGRYLQVEFEGVTKKFVLPAAVLKGFLQFDDEEPEKICIALNEVNTRRNELENKVTSIDVQLHMLE